MRKDFKGSLIILLVCIFFLYQTTQIQTLDINTGLGADFYPRVILIFIITLSIISMILSYFKHRNIEREESKDSFSWKVFLIFVFFGIYIFTLDFIGFVVGSTLFMMIIYLLIVPHQKNWKQNIVIALCLFLSAFAVSYIFENYLDVFLPSGFLF